MEYLSPLAQQGVLGVMLVISLLANAYQYRRYESRYQELWEKRLEDLHQWKDQSENVNEKTRLLTEGVKQSVDMILTLLQNGSRRRSR